MNIPSTAQQTSKHYLPKGTSVELNTLQQLRYLAKQCAVGKNSSSKALLGGNYKSRSLNRGMEFEEVRQYQPGDDIRTIDWRVTARTQTVHSKRYVEEKEKPIVTAVDQQSSLFFGSRHCFKSVYACHLAALINWAALNNSDRSGGIVLSPDALAETRATNNHIGINRWLQQLTQANQALHQPHVDKPVGFEQLLERILHTTQTGTDIYIISDFYALSDYVIDKASPDTCCERLLFQITRRHRTHLLWLIDPLETKLPSANKLSVSNGDQVASLSATKANHKLEAYFAKKQAYLSSLSRQLKCQLTPVSTLQAPIDCLKGLQL